MHVKTSKNGYFQQYFVVFFNQGRLVTAKNDAKESDKESPF
jgi:hypothetical protein